VPTSFTSIRWPTAIRNPPGLDCCTDETDATEETEDTEDTDVVVGGCSPCIASIEDALHYSTPTQAHTNNQRLFDLARALKTLEVVNGKLKTEELMDTFDQWYTRANKFLRSEQSKDEYLMEFLKAYQKVKHPIGASLQTAWKAANEQPLPPEAIRFEKPAVRLLVALCRQLQLLAKKKPFFLSARTAQRLLGLSRHTTASLWLAGLCGAGILKLASKGRGLKASRYFYQSIM
jgi:hypothetical protein